MVLWWSVPMPVRLSLFLPTFATDLAKRRSRLDLSHPVVLTVADQQREIVGACCQVAAGAGIFPGMALADARALVSSSRCHIAPLDGASVERALHRLAVRLLQATPIVALDGTGGVWLDASGCERVYGGIDRLIRRLASWLGRVGVAARIAAAPTWGAAWAVARFGDGDAVMVSKNDVRAALSPLPLAALRIDSDIIERLALVGVARIEDLAVIPRMAIAERFGGGVLRRMDQALGTAVEPITPIRPAEPIITERMFDGSTRRLEDIQRCVQMLVGRVAAALARREQGCRRLDVTLYRSDMPPLPLVAAVSRPTRDAKHLWTLLRPKTERAQLGYGVVGVRVRARDAVRLPHEQTEAWSRTASGQQTQAVACLVDTLIARLPHESVCRITAVPSHLPEHSFVFEPIDRIDGGGGGAMESEAAMVEEDRPSLLLTRAVPIDVTLLLPDGPIASIREGGGGWGRDATHRITASVGPERIEGEWWQDDGPIRDYFKVQTQAGRWLWIFREVMDGRWYLHGEWA
jgi:protein ImuB